MRARRLTARVFLSLCGRLTQCAQVAMNQTSARPSFERVVATELYTHDERPWPLDVRNPDDHSRTPCCAAR